jgi:hypothetical protein
VCVEGICFVFAKEDANVPVVRKEPAAFLEDIVKSRDDISEKKKIRRDG